MIIAIDFDGTIVEHRYPRVGQSVPGAIQWMRRFQELGAKLILHTMRSDGPDGPTLTDAVNYCGNFGITFWGVNSNPEQHTWTSSPKTHARLYIDDAAFGCPMHTPDGFHYPVVDWGVVGPSVEKQILASREVMQRPHDSSKKSS